MELILELISRAPRAAVEESLVDATELMEKHAWEALRQTVAVKARNHAGTLPYHLLARACRVPLHHCCRCLNQNKAHQQALLG